MKKAQESKQVLHRRRMLGGMMAAVAGALGALRGRKKQRGGSRDKGEHPPDKRDSEPRIWIGHL